MVRRDNYYVPRFYLRRWANDEGKLWSYRLLVSHRDVPLWKHVSTGGTAYHRHLYTRLVGGSDTDDIERWLDADFEAAAQEAIERAVTGGRLKPRDWMVLSRFLAAQHVRTPARLRETVDRWHKMMPRLLDETLRSSVKAAEAAHAAGQVL